MDRKPTGLRRPLPSPFLCHVLHIEALLLWETHEIAPVQFHTFSSALTCSGKVYERFLLGVNIEKWYKRLPPLSPPHSEFARSQIRKTVHADCFGGKKH